MQLDWEALRPGQRGAVEMIEGRVRRGERTTALVLPCRYGKSDIIRVASLKLWDEGCAAGTITLSPGTALRKQMADATKWDEALRRYRVGLKAEPKIASVVIPKPNPNPNGEMFLSATIQMIQNNTDIFAQWIESQVHKTGLPVLVFVDECHTGSDDNEWGKVVPVFTDAGAHVVLLTATAERSDDARIPGFEFEILDEEEVTVYRSTPGSRPELVRVDVLQGLKTKLRLVPDYAVSFAEAWSIGALCKVSRTPFDIDLRTVKGVDEEHRWLSELPPGRSRQVLGTLVRDPAVIREGCRNLVDRFRERRQFQPDVQAIVYCGNDIEKGGSRRLNKHPAAIRSALLDIDPALEVLIATSSEGKDDNILDRLVGGHGDILIVKQMAGIGLDIPRLKIGLDLSPTRTFAAMVQRLLRPATPYQGIMVMEWLGPDDVTAAAHFEKLVKSQGGEAQASDLSVVDSYEKERKDATDQPLLFVDDVVASDFDDSSGLRAKRDLWRVVEKITTHFPAITATYTQAEIASHADAFNMPDDDVEAPTVRDTSIAADSLRQVINEIIKKAAGEYQRLNGLSYARYPETIEHLWSQAKRGAGWPRGTELSDLDDLELLERVRDAAEALYSSLWRKE